MDADSFKLFLKGKLMENIGLDEYEAEYDAQSMVDGKRTVRNGQYAILETMNDDDKLEYKYYVRNLKINPIWNRKKILNICRENKFIIESGSVKFFEWSKLSKFLKKKLSSNSNYLIT